MLYFFGVFIPTALKDGHLESVPLTLHFFSMILLRKTLYSSIRSPVNSFTSARLPDTALFLHLWSSPRPISDSQLHTLLHFHLCPIYLVLFKGSYSLQMGYLILRGASRLDAFSVYPFRTWLLCHAPGSATDSPEVRPSRSSRTKDSSSQISYAHAG